MSIKIVGAGQLLTANNTILSTAATATLSCRYRLDLSSVLPIAGLIFSRSNSTIFRLFFNGDGSLRTYVNNSAGVSTQYNIFEELGRTYHLMWTWANGAQKIYVNGVLVKSGASATTLQAAGTGGIQIGSSSLPSGAIIKVAECYLWSGVTATASEVIDIRDRVTAPTAWNSGSIVWGAPLTGTNGATVTNGDTGLADYSGAFPLLTGGSGTMTWDNDAIDYEPAISVSPRILESGKMIGFFFSDRVTGAPVYPTTKASDPTIVVNGGSPITLSTPAFSTGNDPNLDVSMYGLSTPIVAGDVITYSASDGWMTVPFSTANSTFGKYAGAVSGGSVNNLVGVPNYTAVTPTMKQGLNLGSPSYYAACRADKNLFKQTSLTSGVTGWDANGKPNAGSTTYSIQLPTPSTVNHIDSLEHVAPVGRYVLVWDEASPSNDSNMRLGATNGGGTSSAWAIVTEVTGLAENPVNGLKRKRFYDVTRPASPTDMSLPLYVVSDRYDWVNGYAFGPGNAIDYTDPMDDVLKAYVAGSGLIRYMDMNSVNNAKTSRLSQMRPLTDFSYRYSRPSYSTLVSADPVASLAPYSYDKNWMAVLFTTSGAHGLNVGETVTVNEVANTTKAFSVTLNAAITTTSQTVIVVVSNAGVAKNDYILIDSEYVQVSVVNGNGTGLTIIRGMAGTTAATHSNGTVGSCQPQAVYASDGVTRGSMSLIDLPILTVPSSTTFTAMIFHGNPGIGSDTVNAWATTQNFAAFSSVGRASTNTACPYPDIFAKSSSAGVDAWVCIPIGADDTYVTAIAEYARDNLTPGLKVRPELSNEIWNQGFTQFLIAGVFAYNGTYLVSSPGSQSRHQWQAQRQADVWDIFDGVFSAAGRASDVVHIAAGWVNDPTVTQTQVDRFVALSKRLDEFAVAPYWNMPAAHKNAAASWDSDQFHDYWQILATRGSPKQTARSEGYGPQHHAIIKGAFPSAKLVTYEGSIQLPIDSGVSNYIPKIHDFFYHPRWYDTLTAMMTSLQNQGYEQFTYYELCHQSPWNSLANYGGWTLVYWHGQQAGYGDASDGKANNLDCLATTKLSTVSQDLLNVNVGLQAWYDWAAASGGGGGAGSGVWDAVAPLWIGAERTGTVAAGAGTTIVSPRAGRVLGVLVTSAGSGAGYVYIYDNASTNSGTIIGVIPATTAVGDQFYFDLPSAFGVVVSNVTSGPGFTILYS